jgi:hypothetical protein
MWEPIGRGFTPAGLSNSEFRPRGAFTFFYVPDKKVYENPSSGLLGNPVPGEIFV